MRERTDRLTHGHGDRNTLHPKNRRQGNDKDLLAVACLNCFHLNSIYQRRKTVSMK